MRLTSMITTGAALMAALLGPSSVHAQNSEKDIDLPPMMEREDADWPSLRQTLRERLMRRLPSSRMTIASAELDKCRIPVLLPTHDGIDRTMRVFPQTDKYAAFVKQDDHSVEVIGTRIRRRDGASLRESREIMRNMREGRRRYFISRSEYGVDLSFSLFRVAYTISVECTPGVSAPLCATDDYVVSLFDSMAFAGGRPEEGETVEEGAFIDQGGQ